MKDINEIIADCADRVGLHSYLYARVGEANYLMDEIKVFPVILRLFNEAISETSLPSRRRRTTTFYLCDALGEAEPDTGTVVAPIVSEMEKRAFDFIDCLRHEGIEVSIVNNITPFMGRFDALTAGVSFRATLTYSVC